MKLPTYYPQKSKHPELIWLDLYGYFEGMKSQKTARIKPENGGFTPCGGIFDPCGGIFGYCDGIFDPCGGIF
jgi:hypothetical protein